MLSDPLHFVRFLYHGLTPPHGFVGYRFLMGTARTELHSTDDSRRAQVTGATEMT